MSDEDELDELRERLRKLEEKNDLRQRIAELEAREDIPSDRPTNPIRGRQSTEESRLATLEAENARLKSKLKTFEGMDPIELFYTDPLSLAYLGVRDEMDLMQGILSGLIPLESPPDRPADRDWIRKRMAEGKANVAAAKRGRR